MIAEHDTKQMRELVEKLVHDGNYQEALAQLNRAVSASPAQVELLLLKANALIGLGQGEHALSTYDEILRSDPNHPGALAGKGDLLATMARYDEAISHYDKAFEADHRNVGILRSKGLVLAGLKRFEEAIREFDKVLQASEHVAQTLCNKGDALLELGQYTEAMKCFVDAAAAEPGFFQASDWTARGDRLYQLKKMGEAVAFYDKALAADKQCTWAWRGKGLALSADPARVPEALQCYDEAAALEPQNALIMVDKGNLLFKEGKFEEAIPWYRKASDLDPAYFYAWFNRGMALQNLEEYPQAIEVFDKALEIDPNDAESWAQKGYCLTELNRLEESILCFDKVLEAVPNHFWANTNKGWAYAALGKHAEAIGYFDAAIKIDKGEIVPWTNKLKSLLELGRYEEAKDCAEAALDSVREQADALTNAGLVYSEYFYDNETAMKTFERSLQLKPGDQGARKNIAECLVKLGRYKEGRSQAAEMEAELTDAMTKCVMRYLVMATYALESDEENRAREFTRFLERFRAWEVEKQKGKNWTWRYRGLIDSIRKSGANEETKYLLLSAIDLQEGRVPTSSLSYFAGASAKAAAPDALPESTKSTP